MKSNIYSTANYLTVSRVLMIPLIMISLSFDGKMAAFFACILFSLASITDWVDGYLARKQHTVSTLGKFLDPLADKLLVMATMVMLIPLGRIEAWIVIVILAREIAITGLRSIASSENIVIDASDLGKFKTGFQIAALIGLTMHYEYYSFNFHFAGTVLLWMALGFTLWSGWDYVKQFKGLIVDEPDSSS